MSDLTLFKKDKLPAYLKNIARDDITKSMLGASGVPKISIKGSVFRKIVGGEEVMKNEDRAMNIVIVGSAQTEYRTFYAGVYREGENNGPACWSSDGVSPDQAVGSPQSPRCDSCQQNIKGSGQGDSRACRYSRYLAVVLENDLDGDVLQLVLPSQSVFGKGEKGKLPLRQYAKFLDAHNLPITAVVTEMRFDTNSATPKLTFKPTRVLTHEEYLKCRERADTTEATDAISMRFVATKVAATEEFAVDDETAAIVKAAVLQHAESPPESPPVDEPRVRGKTKEEDVKSVLDQWADDE